MKRLSLCLSFLLLSLALATPVAAAEPVVSPTATPRVTSAPRAVASPVPDETALPTASADPVQTTQNLRQRIEKIVEEKRDQIEGVLDDLSGKKRGFIGEVQRVTAETITLKTNKGTQILSITPQLSITKAGKTIKVEEIAVGDWAIAIGTTVDDAFKPERLVISSTSLLPPKPVVSLGAIETYSRTSFSVTPRSGAPAQTFALVKTTEFQDMNGDPLKATTLPAEQPVLVVGIETTNGNEARVIRLLSPLTTPTPSPRTNAR
jgi:hypothetical protein